MGFLYRAFTRDLFIIATGMDKKIALVTGASRGIGRAVAFALAGGGCHVLINFRSRQDKAQETSKLIVSSGGSSELCPFDVADA